jgi:hypothetical protein
MYKPIVWPLYSHVMFTSQHFFINQMDFGDGIRENIKYNVRKGGSVGDVPQNLTLINKNYYEVLFCIFITYYFYS